MKTLFILAHGWIFAANIVEETTEFYIVEKADNIEYWGTTKGLPELCDGYTDKTRSRRVSGRAKILKCNVIISWEINEENEENEEAGFIPNLLY